MHHFLYRDGNGLPARLAFGEGTQVLAVADQILQAYRDLGMRVSYSFALRDQNRLVYEADDRFLSRLPPQIAAELTPWLQGQSMPY